MAGHVARQVASIAHAGAGAVVSAPRPRPDAGATIRSLADALASHAVPALRPFDLWGTRLAPPRLVPIGTDDAIRAADDLRGLVRWSNDGNCYARAMVGAARMDQLLTGTVQGPRDAVHAAIAVIPTSRRETGWTFHAATAFRAGDGSIQVIDHLLGTREGRASGIFSVEEWAALVGSDASRVRIQHAVDNVPTGGGPLTAPATARTIRQLAGTLVRSIDRA